MFAMVEVTEIPKARKGKKATPWIDQLRGFMDSGKKAVRLVDTPEDKKLKERAYLGMTMAAKKGEFAGKVRVIKGRDGLYLERLG